MTAIKVCNTMIKPDFEFGSTILYICCSRTLIERLQELQNKAIRSILNARFTLIRLMSDTLKLLNIQQILVLNTTFYSKIKNRQSAY